MTREEILKDQWVIDHYGDFHHPNYLNPDFEAGVDYGEEKVIEKAEKWLDNINTDDYMVSGIFQMSDLIIDFKKAMEL